MTVDKVWHHRPTTTLHLCYHSEPAGYRWAEISRRKEWLVAVYERGKFMGQIKSHLFRDVCVIARQWVRFP